MILCVAPASSMAINITIPMLLASTPDHPSLAWYVVFLYLMRFDCRYAPYNIAQFCLAPLLVELSPQRSKSPPRMPARRNNIQARSPGFVCGFSVVFPLLHFSGEISADKGKSC